MSSLTSSQREAVEATRVVSAAFWNLMSADESLSLDEETLPSAKKFLKKYYSQCCEKDSPKSTSMILKYIDGTVKVLDSLGKMGDVLKNLKTSYDAVSAKTSSLHETCDQLMESQAKLASFAEEIRTRLTYFDNCEKLNQKLNSPLLSVTRESFLHLISSIDEGIAFLSSKADYKDSTLYLDRYHQCLSKALFAVKTFVFRQLSSCYQWVQDRLSDTEQDKGEETFTIFYGLFATHAQPVHSLIRQVERKWENCPEYVAMLDECYTQYFSQREALIRSSVDASIQQLFAEHTKSTCSLIRSGFTFFFRLYDDERNLFMQFFTRHTPFFDDFLEQLCRKFYNVARPVVIHVQHLETLSELCIMLKVEMIEERCRVNGDGIPTAYQGLYVVLFELVGDITERLIYRTEQFSEKHIAGYNPAPGDLAYPEKLQMMHEISENLQFDMSTHAVSHNAPEATNQHSGRISETSQGRVSPADLHGLWYPTVQRTVMCLAKLYRCLDASVFQGVLEQILGTCFISVKDAAKRIREKKDALNGHLFLIKHLLILREQTASFRADTFQESVIDFGKTKELALDLLHQRSQWFSLNGNNVFLRLLLQEPLQISISVVDSRRRLDLEMKAACQNFITEISNSLVLEIQSILQQYDASVQSAAATAVSSSSASVFDKDVKQQPCGNVNQLRDAVSRTYRELKEHVPKIRATLSLYFNNRETENILYSLIRNAVSEVFARLSSMVSEQFSEEERQIIGCPTAEELTLLLSPASR